MFLVRLVSAFKIGSFLLFFVLFSITLFSQEESIEGNSQEVLVPLKYDKTLQKEMQKSTINGKYFFIDTLDLPFMDDFSRNHQKNYGNYFASEVKDSAYVKYKINNLVFDTLWYLRDTTYSLFYNNLSSLYDTLPNPIIEVVIFNNPADLSLPTDTQKVWIAFQYTIDQNGDTIDTLFIPTTYLFVNPDTVQFIQDNSFYYWIDERPNVYINNRYSNDAPTIGVATFDGINHVGKPYDISFDESYGPADTLTSKPFHLNYLPSDSVYLSFFYEPKGLGDIPEEGDSLVLEFYNPSPWSKKWNHIWAIDGAQTNLAFTQVKISIADTAFLKEGFQLRFRNYARISGYYDHWHIDYVWLDKARTAQAEVLQDVAYLKPINTLLKNYTSVPYDHFKASPGSYMASSVSTSLSNLSDINRFVNKTDQFLNTDGTTIVANTNVVNFGSLPQGVTSTPIPVTDSPNFFTFPSNSPSTARFPFKSFINVTPDVNNENDTLYHTQIFDTYYSYDDHSAEITYKIVGPGSQAAVKFDLSLQDTLKGLLFYFPQTYNDLTKHDIKIKVWKDIFAEDLLFQLVVTPRYGEQLNGFVRFPIEETVLLDGSYYIGWENIGSDDVLVGFDKNIDNTANMFINVGGGWIPSSLAGTVMVRPDFGNANLFISNKEKIQPENSCLIRPNPIQTGAFMVCSDGYVPTTIKMYDLLGNMHIISLQGNQFNVSSFSSGIYIVEWQGADFKTYTQKIIVTK